MKEQRYKCTECTRYTSQYPFGCNEPECPIKRDMNNDMYWSLTVGFPILLAIGGAFIFIMLIGANK